MEKIKNLLTKEIFIVGFIFLFALTIRLVYVLPLSPTALAPDSPSWEAPALNLLSGKGYGEARRPPLYPFFLTFIYFVFGQSIVAVRIFHSILGALTCVIVYFIGKKIFSRVAGIISAVLLGFYPYLIFYTGVILNETLFAFMLSLTVLFLLLAPEKNKNWLWIISGISLGLTILTKSVILTFISFIVFWIYLVEKNKLVAWKNIFFIGLFTILTIVPWTLRNYLYYKEFLLISTGAHDFWITNNDVAMQLETTGPQDTPAPEDWIWYPKERYQEITKLPLLEAEKVFWKEGLAWVKNNQAKFRWLLWRRFLRFWRLWPYMATKRNKIIAGLTSGIYLPLAWLGMILSLKKHWKKSILLIFLFISFTLAYLPFHCMIRYRTPIDPLILVFTGYTVSLISEKIVSKIIKGKNCKFTDKPYKEIQ